VLSPKPRAAIFAGGSETGHLESCDYLSVHTNVLAYRRWLKLAAAKLRASSAAGFVPIHKNVF
jgi:hypothetical protein